MTLQFFILGVQSQQLTSHLDALLNPWAQRNRRRNQRRWEKRKLAAQNKSPVHCEREDQELVPPEESVANQDEEEEELNVSEHLQEEGMEQVRIYCNGFFNSVKHDFHRFIYLGRRRCR